jgi:hypothetical protein
MCVPYTYRIKFLPTGQEYYGVRHGKKANPDTFWKTYFTSSKIVKGLITEHGLEAFVVVKVKEHETKEDALKHEELFLTSVDAGRSEHWLNMSNGGKNFCIGSGEKNHNFGKHPSEETLAKLREANLGENHPQFGKHRTEKTLAKIRENHADVSGENHYMFGKHHTEETLAKLREANLGENSPLAKSYIVTNPDGYEESITGIAKFCREHNLNTGAMAQVARGKRKHHKGFKCEYCTKIPDVLTRATNPAL